MTRPMKSSPVWTEVATGHQARSFRRWLRRVAVPILLRYLFLLILVVLVVATLVVLLPDPPPIVRLY